VSAIVSSIFDPLPSEALGKCPEPAAPSQQGAPVGNAGKACGVLAGTSGIDASAEVSGSGIAAADDPAETIAPRLDALCDEELLRRYTDADDQLAFQVLYGRYRVRLHRFVLRLSRDSHEAEEVFQETWMAVIRGRVKHHPTARFAAYLFSIAHRRLADRWRRLKRFSTLQMDGEIPCDPDEVADDFAVAPEEWTQHAQLQRALMTELGKLPVHQREVFLMKAEADLSLEEIAEIMGATREATKSRLRYALARLRAALRNWK
jgi:RNA polymerase sigma-70 factor, ECF subfamily